MHGDFIDSGIWKLEGKGLENCSTSNEVLLGFHEKKNYGGEI